jgi:hypothetical protein
MFVSIAVTSPRWPQVAHAQKARLKNMSTFKNNKQR